MSAIKIDDDLPKITGPWLDSRLSIHRQVNGAPIGNVNVRCPLSIILQITTLQYNKLYVLKI